MPICVVFALTSSHYEMKPMPIVTCACKCEYKRALSARRDVSGVELLMNNHQSLKAEIDTREDNFSACISLGRELLSRQHYASADIKDKLLQLTNQRNALLRRWEERWENLQLSQYRRSLCESRPRLSLQRPNRPSLRSPGGVPVRARRGRG